MCGEDGGEEATPAAVFSLVKSLFMSMLASSLVVWPGVPGVLGEPNKRKGARRGARVLSAFHLFEMKCCGRCRENKEPENSGTAEL